MSLEIITGNLAEAYEQIVPGTMQHVDQLQAARVTDPELRKQPFYTGDYNQYALRGRKQVPMLGIAREPHNLILENIDTAFRELTTDGNYHPNVREAERVFRARGRNATVLVDLTKLGLQNLDDEFSYFEIGTSPSEYKSLNPEQRKLAERVEGKGKAFTATMKMLMDSGVEKTRIYVLNPDYVRVHAEKGPIGRASWLNLIGYDSYFDAVDRNVYDHDRLRGVRRVVAAGDGAENSVPSEIRAPSFEEVWQVFSPRMPEILHDEARQELQGLYKP